MRFSILLLLFVFVFTYSNAQSKRDFKRLWKKTHTEIYRSNYRAADSLLEKALTIKPQHVKATILHANVLLIRKKYKEAAEKYETAIKMEPKKKELYLSQSDCFTALNQPAKAEDVLTRVIKFQSKLIPAFQKRAIARIDLKKFEEAQKDADRAVALNPRLHGSHFLRAVALDSLKNYEAARLTYEKAILLAELSGENQKGILPIYQPYFVNLGKVYNELKLYDNALQTFDKALTKIDPKDSALPEDYLVYFFRSKPNNNKAEYSLAIADLNKSIALNSKFSEGFIFRARIYAKTSQFHSAISDYTKAIQFTNQSQLYKERATCHFELEKFAEALTDYNTALSLNPGNSELEQLIAETSERLYQANKESQPPVVRLNHPIVDAQGFINLSLDQQETVLTGEVSDQSLIKKILVNGKESQFFRDQMNTKFIYNVNNKINDDKLEVSAIDIYNNRTDLVYKIGKVLSDARLRYNFTGKIAGGDGDLKPLSNLTIYLLNKRGERVATTKTDGFGNFNFEALPYDKNELSLVLDSTDIQVQQYNKIIIADKTNNAPVLVANKGKNSVFSFSVLPYDPNVLTLLEVDEAPLNLDIKGRLVNGDDLKSPLSYFVVHLVDDKGNIIDSKKTDAFGAFLFNRIAKAKSYSIKLDPTESSKLTCKQIVITDDKGKVVKQFGKNDKAEFAFEILPADQFYLATITEEDPWMRVLNLNTKKKELEIIESIYYTSGSFEILPEAESVMTKVISSLKANPKIALTVESHTDSQAGDDFNFELSNKRALRVVDFLIKDGIDKKRLTGKGLGESQLTNRCANGVECSDAEHRQNRRTVFKLQYVD